MNFRISFSVSVKDVIDVCLFVCLFPGARDAASSRACQRGALPLSHVESATGVLIGIVFIDGIYRMGCLHYFE